MDDLDVIGVTCFALTGLGTPPPPLLPRGCCPACTDAGCVRSGVRTVQHTVFLSGTPMRGRPTAAVGWGKGESLQPASQRQTASHVPSSYAKAGCSLLVGHKDAPGHASAAPTHIIIGRLDGWVGGGCARLSDPRHTHTCRAHFRAPWRARLSATFHHAPPSFLHPPPGPGPARPGAVSRAAPISMAPARSGAP